MIDFIKNTFNKTHQNVLNIYDNVEGFGPRLVEYKFYLECMPLDDDSDQKEGLDLLQCTFRQSAVFQVLMDQMNIKDSSVPQDEHDLQVLYAVAINYSRHKEQLIAFMKKHAPKKPKKVMIGSHCMHEDICEEVAKEEPNCEG